MSAYTRFGTAIWDWEPFIELPYDARNLWLGLYTTREAKRLVPGLWHGSITTMAEAAKMPVDDALKALDTLLDHGMVEFDQRLRVLRLTVLPDAGESPANGNVIRGWFTRFKSVPACQVRDAHVRTLLWIMEEWVRENPEKAAKNNGTISEGHWQAWNETFAHIRIPPERRRGVRRLIDSDTSTSTQPSLFDPPETVPLLQSGASDPDSLATRVPVFAAEIGSSPNSLFARSESNESHRRGNGSGTVSEPFGNRSDQDPDLDHGSGSGSLIGAPAVATVLQLVPPSRGIDPDDLAEVLHVATEGPLAFPKALTRDQRLALGRALEMCRDVLPGPAALDVLREYIKRNVDPFTSNITPDVVTTPGWLQHAMKIAQAWKAKELARAVQEEQKLAERMALASEARKKLGYEV